jgi:hypothetical protein
MNFPPKNHAHTWRPTQDVIIQNPVAEPGHQHFVNIFSLALI